MVKKKTTKKKATAKKKRATKKKATRKPAEDKADTPPKLTVKQRSVLSAYVGCGNISEACKIAGVTRQLHYQAIQNNVTYRDAFDHAIEDHLDLLRAAATHRAVKGVPRMKFHQGLPCVVPVVDKDGNYKLDKDGNRVTVIYEEREYSDGLLTTLLKARCPEFLDKRRVEHTGADGKPIQTESSQDVKFSQNIQDLSAENLKHLNEE